MHSLSCMPPMTPPVRALTDLLSTLASPGQAPHRAGAGRPLPGTQPMLEKATKSNTTRRYERPGTAGSSSHRHGRAKTPDQRQQNAGSTERKLQDPYLPQDSQPDTRVWACTRFCPLPPSAKLRAAMINTS